jgi:DNA-binding transcriptional LysR family regulator
MARQEINRAAEMAVFVDVVDAGGFSAAAQRLKMTPSAVSKLIARLEARLGTRLLHRSTRQVRATPEGAAFYSQCVRILEDMDSAEREAATTGVPRGRLRINCFVPFFMLYLLPILPEFLQRYPDITVDIASTDMVVDLLEDRTDIAIRAGTLKDSNLVARKLGEGRMVVLGSPEYLARHNLLGFNFRRQVPLWPFLDGKGGMLQLRPEGNALLGDGESMRHMALSGVGLVRLSRMHTKHDIATGRLVPVLEDYNPADLEAVHAVFLGPGKQLPPRVRVMLDYLIEKIRLD